SSGISWTAKGIVFAQGGGGIRQVRADGGRPEQLVRLEQDEAAAEPHILPGGEAVLFTQTKGPDRDWEKANIVVQSLTTNERKTLIEGAAAAGYLPSGHLMYAVGGTAWAVPFDLKQMKVAGVAVPVLRGVLRNTISSGPAGSPAAQLGFSDTGTAIYI